MANGVRHGRFKLGQALHGYADGHRQLSRSIEISPTDARAMLALSDVAGPGLQIGPDGYLTGYPLSESGFYVLAKTWAAPEMPRPGCVWTHSLLIPLDQLEAMQSPEELLELFLHPRTAEAKDFQAQISFAPESASAPEPRNAPLLRRLLSALYERPNAKVVARSHPSFDVAPTVLAIWRQQWPALKSTFRFCTLTSADRSSGKNRFDLQLLPASDRAGRSRFPDVFDADTGADNELDWLQTAVSDALIPGGGALTHFISSMRVDPLRGREAFVPIAQAQMAFDGLNETRSAERLIELGERYDFFGGSILRRAVTEAVVPLTQASARIAGFVARNLENLPADSVVSVAPVIAQHLWLHEPEVYADLARQGGRSAEILEHALSLLPVSTLLDGLRERPKLVRETLRARPELLAERQFWALASDARRQGLAMMRQSKKVRDIALQTIVSDFDPKLAREVAAEFGAAVILRALHDGHADEGLIRAWVDTLREDRDGVAEYLSRAKSVNPTMLVAISEMLHPDEVPNTEGTDPWLHATLGIKRPISQQMDSYLLFRGLGPVSRNPAELLTYAFERIHASAAESALDDDAWRLIEPRLPKSDFWFDWDHCQRLRAAVVDTFISRSLPPSLFGELARDDQLFGALVLYCATSWKGRDYLWRVRDALRGATRARRAEMLNRVLE